MKMLAMQLFPAARATVYFDAKVALRYSVEEVLNRIAKQTDAPYVTVEHPFRSPLASGSAQEFASTAGRLGVTESGDALAADLADLRRQEAAYRGLLTNQPGLADTCFLVQQRGHGFGQRAAALQWLECCWFNELRLYSHREQLSLPFVIDALGVRKHVHVLPTVSKPALLETWLNEHLSEAIGAERQTDYYVYNNGTSPRA